MTRRALAAAVLAIGLAATAAADSSRWWGHVTFLADDSLEGRETGSQGHARAAQYVADMFQKAGLEPAGERGFMQPIQFRTRRIDERRSSLALFRDGNTVPLTLGEDANFSLRIDPAAAVDAPLVFAGHGLDIPDRRINDLDGLDLKGAVVVHFTATPASLSGPLQAHFGSAAERWRMYKAAGAIGTITIANPKGVEIPWSRSSPQRLQPQMSLAETALDELSGQQLAVTMNPARAEVLFAGSGHTLRELLALEDAGQPLPRFALPSRVRATMAVTRANIESQNVVGILRGSDENRRGEFVVLSAHLDHLGVGEPVEGDRIYNGAMDNASGVALILEVAARLRESGQRGARSIVFVAVTGEEKGELGSRFFTAHPTVPARAIVANVNTDMFLPLFPLKELMVLGLDESDLGADIRAVADELKLVVQADPEPHRNRFIRSDQYSFVRAGIPALAMKVGYAPNTAEAAIARNWTAARYHGPSDDVRQPVDLRAADAFVNVVRLLALRIANRSDRPKWNDASFFTRFSR